MREHSLECFTFCITLSTATLVLVFSSAILRGDHCHSWLKLFLFKPTWPILDSRLKLYILYFHLYEKCDLKENEKGQRPLADCGKEISNDYRR